jgi:hypothetical protein
MSFTFPGEPRVRAFGEWDAPMTDDAEWIDAPVGAVCMYCAETIADGDNGAVMPTGFVQHRECSLRGVWAASAITSIMAATAAASWVQTPGSPTARARCWSGATWSSVGRSRMPS